MIHSIGNLSFKANFVKKIPIGTKKGIFIILKIKIDRFRSLFDFNMKALLVLLNILVFIISRIIIYPNIIIQLS
jgi:hypothetical protein